MNVGDTVVFPWGQRRMVEGVIEAFDGPKAQVSLVKSKGGSPIWIDKARLRKVAMDEKALEAERQKRREGG